MSVTVAESAGFCFGVTRAVETLETALRDSLPTATVATLGPIIHNEAYVKSLQARGVLVVNEEEAQKKAVEASKESPFVLLIRAHGILQDTEKSLIEIAANNPYFQLFDCTCPFVKKIHHIADSRSHRAVSICANYTITACDLVV